MITTLTSKISTPICHEVQRNVRHRISELVVKILDVVSKMSERDRESTSYLKATYRKATSDLHNLHIRIGNAAPWISGASILATSSQFFFDQKWTPLTQVISSQIPSFGNLYPTHLQAEEASLQAQQQVRISEITSSLQKQSDTEMKSSLLELFRLVNEAEKSASR